MTNSNADRRPIVYIDSNVFIYAMERNDAISEGIRSLFLHLRAAGGCALSSELTLAEVLAKPEEDQSETLKQGYLDLVGGGDIAVLAPVTRDILIASATLRARRAPKLRLADAVHLATAIQAKCRYFLSNDERLGSFGGEFLVLRPDREGVAKVIAALDGRP